MKRPLVLIAVTAFAATVVVAGGCRLKSEEPSDALDAEDESALALTMINRIEETCAGGCHGVPGGRFAHYDLIEMARRTAPIHNCLTFNGCFLDDLTTEGAKTCVNRCIEGLALESDDWNAGIYHAAAHKGGILDTIVKKADPQADAADIIMAMPPVPPSDGQPTLLSPSKKFKELADWLTHQSDDRDYNEIVAHRFYDPDTAPLPTLAKSEMLPIECGKTSPEILAQIDPDFRLNGVKMFGCDSDWPADPATCLQTMEDSSWINPEPKAVDAVTGEATPLEGLQVKILRKLDGRDMTAYWMRTSPDGRFVSTGNGRIEDLATGGPTGEGRSIIVESASIDPAYDPTNRFFVWPGFICPIAPLYDPSLMEIGTGIAASKCKEENIGVYGTIGSLEGDETIELEGTFSGNVGWDTSDAGGWWDGQAGTVTFSTIDATELEIGDRKKFQLQNEGDFLLSPSSRILLSVANDGDKEAYRLRLVRDATGSWKDAADKWLLMDNERTATVCLKGEKPMMSYDNRFVVFHHHAASDEPQDGGATQEHSNIFIYDVKTGRYVRVTDMKNGYKAYFPHFRADGWIYFQVTAYPENSSEIHQQIVATNAALMLKKLDQAAQ